MQEVRLSIAGMHCDACAARIERLLQKEPGVRQATVSFAASEARLRMNPDAVNRESLAEIVWRAGFDVVSME